MELNHQQQTLPAEPKSEKKFHDVGNLLNNSEADIGEGSLKEAGRDRSAGQDVFGDETNAEVQYKTMGWM